MELADVLATIISRVRGADGMIPLSPPTTSWKRSGIRRCRAVQWRIAGQNRNVSQHSIRKSLNELASGLTDAAGQPLQFQPHDFRRIFTTEAILNGMPPTSPS